MALLLATFLDENAPNGLSVVVLAMVPLVAFGLPWWLAKRDRSSGGKLRRTAILVSAFPVLVFWLVLTSVLAPADHVGKPPVVARDEAIIVRSPRTVGELLIRAGIGGIGAAVLIWAAGAVAARTTRAKPGSTAPHDAATLESPTP